jgi:hypothetical protein
MKEKKLSEIQTRKLKILEDKDIERRYYSRNIEAMLWCNRQGLTIYATAQSSNPSMVKLFVQKGIPFRPLNNILYDQSNVKDVMKYAAAIDVEYERLYIKMKDKK